MTPHAKQITKALGSMGRWAHQCHAASIHLIESGIFEEARVARGVCKGVGAQHSWVVLGSDCYDPGAEIVDPTLWSYDESVDGVWIGSMRAGRHRPHGTGNIWGWGRPAPATGVPVELTPRKPFSDAARSFLAMLGPLDREGWRMLAHAPVGGWPAAEIIDAMCESDLGEFVPIDIRGMLTDRNPGDLYPRITR